MKARGTRLLLTVTVASAVAVGVCLFVAATLVLRATGSPLGTALALSGSAASVFVVWAASSMLLRRVARPVERVLAAAEAIQASAPGELPLVGESGLGLDQAALAFERTAAALAEERATLAAKVDELTRANRALADARESLLRSEKLATVGRLAAGVAHEVGNPLGAITGYAELARTRLPARGDPLLANAIDRIASAAVRIDHTVRGLLDFARPGASELGPVSVPAALEAALELARVQPRFRNVEVTVRIPDRLPRVQGRDRELCQVFLNLLLNAADAMEGRGRIAVDAVEAPGGVEITLADTGSGIAMDDIPRVFDPFFSTKAPGAGSGLGLAITHSIVDSFGGTIDAANAEPVGAVFRLRLRPSSA
jgi:C4-dicarboxylate-specific signal transduction histidine kinase